MSADPVVAASMRSAARKLLPLLVARARENPKVFMPLVMKDERSGNAIKMAPLHHKWQDLLTEHTRVVFWSHVEGGKTSQIAVGRVLWELGHDPSMRIAIVSNTKDMAMKIVRLIAQYIERSEELHWVFPHLVPTKNPKLPWKSTALTVERPGVGGKDPSVQACGVHGNILGSRVDLLVLDDVLDHENTATPAPREDVYRWLRSTPFSRLTAEARVWITGNAWHPEDAMHRLAKEPRFKAFRFPVVTPDGALTWPERWPHDRIVAMKADLGPLEAARQLMCQARDDTSARFKREWIDKCLEAGEGLRICNTLEEAWEQDGRSLDPFQQESFDGTDAFLANAHAELAHAGGGQAFVFCGVDLAVQRADSNDETAFFVMLVEEDGSRRALLIEAGRITGPEILKRIESLYRRFGCMFIVENNAAQHYIVQWARDSNLVIPVIPFTTGRNKAHPEFGVESIGAEMAAGKWRIPNQGGRVEEEFGEWIQELLFYDPREHVGDRVMASWFAREGARRFADYHMGPSQDVRVRVIGEGRKAKRTIYTDEEEDEETED